MNAQERSIASLEGMSILPTTELEKLRATIAQQRADIEALVAAIEMADQMLEYEYGLPNRVMFYYREKRQPIEPIIERYREEGEGE